MKRKSRLSLTTKGQISNKKFDLVNWEGIYKAMKSLPLGTKLGSIKFASRFCGTGKMIKLWALSPLIYAPASNKRQKSHYM